MISWIQGEVITLWQTNNKFYVLINCNNLGYEIQVLEQIFISLKSENISEKKISLWIKHIKKEDSDSLFGFISKDQKDFFDEILSIKGIGSQIAMAMLNKFSIHEIVDAVNLMDKKLISSVQGIGQKMTERIILELKSNFFLKSRTKEEDSYNDFLEKSKEISSIFADLDLTLQSLNYSKKEIKKVLLNLSKDIKDSKNKKDSYDHLSFEKLLKESMELLELNNSNLGQ